MGRQKVWAHSLCKQIGRLMFGWVSDDTHTFTLINLMCTVAILQLHRCMYSRFRWANVVNALNHFNFFPVPAWLLVVPYVQMFTRVLREEAGAWGETSEMPLLFLIRLWCIVPKSHQSSHRKRNTNKNHQDSEGWLSLVTIRANIYC